MRYIYIYNNNNKFYIFKHLLILHFIQFTYIMYVIIIQLMNINYIKTNIYIITIQQQKQIINLNY